MLELFLIIFSIYHSPEPSLFEFNKYPDVNYIEQAIFSNLVEESDSSNSETELCFNNLGSKFESGNISEKAKNEHTDILTDYDGNTYKTIIIGKQEWMAENLKSTNYPDGTAIPLVTDDIDWDNLADNNTNDAYCFYNNNENREKDYYGALYTWAAAMNESNSSAANPSGVQGVCPMGWHLPSDDEWTELEDFITNNGHTGTDLKTTWGWVEDQNGTDSYGFSALPGGYRFSYYGTFYSAGGYGTWWSSTENNSTTAYYRYLYFQSANIFRYSDYKSFGFSVRCVKDRASIKSQK